MADLAAGTNPGVAAHLRAAADAMDSAAGAFDAGDVETAKVQLADAATEHETALGSTTVKDWCQPTSDIR